MSGTTRRLNTVISGRHCRINCVCTRGHTVIAPCHAWLQKSHGMGSDVSSHVSYSRIPAGTRVRTAVACDC